jgi:hypothetical protein
MPTNDQPVHDTEKLMNAKRDRFADKKDVSGRIGETSRFIAFGLVALVFAIHSSSNDLSTSIITNNRFLLNLAGLLGCLSIISDYLQYLCGYISVNDALLREDDSYRYDQSKLAYKGRHLFFWTKQFFAFVGAAVVIGLFSLELF